MSTGSTGIDKQSLYGSFQGPSDKRAAWKDNLARQAAHKALDIPTEDDTRINAPKTINHNGVSPKAAMIVAALAAILGGGTFVGLNQLTAPTTAAKAPSAPPSPATTPAKVIPATPATPPPGWDAIYEVQQPDGSWKQTKREHLTPGS